MLNLNDIQRELARYLQTCCQAVAIAVTPPKLQELFVKLQVTEDLLYQPILMADEDKQPDLQDLVDSILELENELGIPEGFLIEFLTTIGAHLIVLFSDNSVHVSSDEAQLFRIAQKLVLYKTKNFNAIKPADTPGSHNLFRGSTWLLALVFIYHFSFLGLIKKEEPQYVQGKES